MTEETRKQLEELAYCGHRTRKGGEEWSTSFLADCTHCYADFYTITQAYELGEKAGRSEKWISVKDRLPEQTEHWKDGPHEYSSSAPALTFGEKTVVDAGMRSATLDGSGNWSEAGGDILYGITHWMPLPVPPSTTTDGG